MSSPTAPLAAAAREHHAAAAPGSLQRRAAGCAGVVLATTRTINGARRELRQADLDDEVRAAALDLIDQLTEGPTE
ncbi:hypothetical protein F4561_006582 [Lipingzhangella halophila]|uniref:Uncharacterized protein n=1 Tax=Lipingzhangella halophila TaxID=1783352 RepID=A0A7W7RP86_9ACTN|nr:hypothetical protein [Lipingzhangella halophila]MBB4935673.1 hypothetical protein [Lipingzhangella halophila]